MHTLGPFVILSTLEINPFSVIFYFDKEKLFLKPLANFKGKVELKVQEDILMVEVLKENSLE